MTVFLDSSVLVKRYHDEEGSDRVRELFGSGTAPWISELSLVEVVSALARKTREGELEEDEFRFSRDSFLTDAARGMFKIYPISETDLRVAIDFVSSTINTHGVRTLDAVILSAAQSVHGKSGNFSFWTSDKRMRDAGEELGFSIINPAGRTG